MAEPENLKLLGETVGIDLEFEAQEKNVGPFRADILCKDTLDESWVLIENQLERTDHTHLGQLLTYASGLDTVKIIWMAQKFTEEHRATLDWLNEITSEKFAFFGLEIELWKIGDSLIAPKFNVISKPNEWTRTVQVSARNVEGISPHKQAQLEFWTAFRDYMEGKSAIRCQEPGPRHWMNHSIGRSGFRLSGIVRSLNSEAEIRVEVSAGDIDAKKYFALLETQKPEIEGEMGVPLTWHNPSDKQSWKIYTRCTADFLNRSDWPNQHEWLRENLERFHRVFAPRIKQIDVSNFEDEPRAVDAT